MNEAFDDEREALLVTVRTYGNACCYLILSLIYETCVAIFSAMRFKVLTDRRGLARSAVLLVFFDVLHGVGNAFQLLYLCSRLCWTGLGLRANMDEGLRAVACAIARPRWLSSGLKIGLVCSAIAGWMSPSFMTVHPFQSRIADPEDVPVVPVGDTIRLESLDLMFRVRSASPSWRDGMLMTSILSRVVGVWGLPQPFTCAFQQGQVDNCASVRWLAGFRLGSDGKASPAIFNAFGHDRPR